MAKTLVLTFIADDRPGVIETLSDAVSGAGGNWLESRMANLAEKFAGIARIQIADGKIDALKSALDALGAEGFTITVEDSAAAPPAAGPVYVLELLGLDQPGIVRDISRCLAEQKVSVEDMETDIRPAPMGGGELFYAQARVRVPPDLSEAALRQILEAAAYTLMLDITLREEV